jgi:hypothetical protein
MKIGLVILALLISSALQSQDNSAVDQIQKMLSSVQIIKDILNATDTSSNAEWLANDEGIIDSICNSRKSRRDYHSGIEDIVIVSLGNNLQYYEHRVGDLRVTYVVYVANLLKINFEYEFSSHYIDDKLIYFSPEEHLIDSIINTAGLPLQKIYDSFKGTERISGYKYSFYYNETKNELIKNKNIRLEIDFEAGDENFQKKITEINDPAVQLRYGFACSVDGHAPKGLFEFAQIVHFGKIYLAEQLLYSPNPVTRLMAADAIEYYPYNPSLKIKKRVKEIRNDKTVINTCWGCSYENISMKDAYMKSESYRKDIYDGFIFIINK